ncbi:MAG: GSCFA family protein [Thiothrix sp.]|nr:MAG: GSCFA family protein [Thiothrix sp.]
MEFDYNPYNHLPDEAFWKLAVAGRKPLQINGLWKPKFQIQTQDVISTAGSCFAQHIGAALRARGYNWQDSEPAPDLLRHSEELRKAYNYGIFSFRTGNIYTVALLQQWIQWSLQPVTAPVEIWCSPEGRYYDLFRPNIEPQGFLSEAEALESRASTLRAIKRGLENTDIFVFTLGLTEAWMNSQQGYVYPMCPGTIAGEFDTSQHQFKNFNYLEIYTTLQATLEQLKTINPKMRFLLTVSPVPLTATASGKHVLTATSHSKSILRAVAGELELTREDTDYFPSYEIISAFPFRGHFYAENLRSVRPQGVNFVMNSFFACQESALASSPATSQAVTIFQESTLLTKALKQEEEVCEDVLLERFKS